MLSSYADWLLGHGHGLVECQAGVCELMGWLYVWSVRADGLAVCPCVAGFFWDLSQQAAKAGKPDPCPLHTSLLKQVKAV